MRKVNELIKDRVKLKKTKNQIRNERKIKEEKILIVN